MAFYNRAQTHSFTFLVVVITSLFEGSYYVTEGQNHSVRLYFETNCAGVYLPFDANQANLESYRELLLQVESVSAVGWWKAYGGTDYYPYPRSLFYFGSETSKQRVCENKGKPFSNKKSFRHGGASDISVDGISLYEKEEFDGKEILIEQAAYIGITTPILSLIATGNSEWRLFEGQYLDGKSVCIQVPAPGFTYYVSPGVQQRFNLTTIGSLYKDCNKLKIEEYKKKNNITNGLYFKP